MIIACKIVFTIYMVFAFVMGMFQLMENQEEDRGIIDIIAFMIFIVLVSSRNFF